MCPKNVNSICMSLKHMPRLGFSTHIIDLSEMFNSV